MNLSSSEHAEGIITQGLQNFLAYQKDTSSWYHPWLK